MGRKRGFTVDRDALFADYQSGMGQHALAKKYGMNQSNVSMNLRKHPEWASRRSVIRIERNPRANRKDYSVDAFIEDYNAGLSIRAIAEKHGVSETLVHSKVKGHSDWRERRRALRLGCHPVVDGARRCLTCDEVKPTSGFPKHGQSPFGILAHCTPCASKLRSEYSKELYRTMRDKVVAGYGGACASCGFDDDRALHVDHVNNDGFIERKTTRAIMLLRKLIREGFPETHQLLCANCNAIKAHEAGSFSRPRKSETG